MKQDASRRLALNKETLRVLGEEQLDGVVGGKPTNRTCPVITVDCTNRCTILGCTGFCPAP